MPTLTKKKRSYSKKISLLKKKRKRNPAEPADFHIEMSTIYGARIVKLHEKVLYVYEQGTFVRHPEYPIDVYKEDKSLGLLKWLPLYDSFLVKFFKDAWTKTLHREVLAKERQKERQKLAGFAGIRRGSKLISS